MIRDLAAPPLRVHNFLPESYANGPGRRSVVWLQGCTLGCPACFNPETHNTQAGKVIAVGELTRRIASLRDRVEGLTISGGEPLQQLEALTVFLEQVRIQTTLSTLVFTGFTWTELQRLPRITRLLEQIDVLIAGRFQLEQRLAQGLRGSSNKTLHFLSDRYTPSDLEHTPDAEIFIQPDGTIDLSGIDPLRGL